VHKTWEQFAPHSIQTVYYRFLPIIIIIIIDTFLWLSKEDLKAGTESEIVAAQDQALNTKYYATKILHIRDG